MNKKYQVVGFGALNWDDIRQVDEIVGPDGETSGNVLPGSPGGSAANTITGLSRLGVDAAFVGAVGNDEIGKHIMDALEKDGVAPFITIKDGHTGNCIILVDKKGERRIFVFPEVNDIISIHDFSETTINTIKASEYFYSSTFASTNSFTSLNTQMELSKIAPRFVLSPGTLYTDPGSKVVREKKEIIHTLLENTDILFLNKEEIGMLTGQDDYSKAATRIQKEFGNIDIIAVTLGKNGCYIRSGTDDTEVSACRPRKILDTVGAGDSFAAGFMFGLINGKSLRTCGKMGNYIASRVIEKTGARNGLPLRSDSNIEKLLSQQ